MWREGGTASAAEISAAAVRVAPFLKTPSADLARSLLDAGRPVLGSGAAAQILLNTRQLPHLRLPSLPAAVHWAAQRVRAEGPTAAPAFAAVLALAPQVSRTERPQRQLHLLRQAASQAKTDEQRLEEAIEQRVEWLKGTLRCDSVAGEAGRRRRGARPPPLACPRPACAGSMPEGSPWRSPLHAARGRVVASLARTSMEAGGDIQAIRATLIQARRLGAGGTAVQLAGGRAFVLARPPRKH